MDIQNLISQISNLVILYAPILVGAIILLIIGNWLIKKLLVFVNRRLEKSTVDEMLSKFIVSFLGMVLKVLLVISALGIVGIEMTSFIAILGAAAFAIGMALSGTLQNFAGGVMIIVFKPFKIGDFIDAQGYSGVVSGIQMFNTILKTPDNKTIIIPNGGLSTSAMTNFSVESQRRVDWTFSIGYGDDADQAKQVMQKLCDDDARILKDPESFIALSELADSSVNFVVRVWVKADDYWAVFFDMNEKIYKTFAKEGLSIPYPQMDVHVHK